MTEHTYLWPPLLCPDANLLEKGARFGSLSFGSSCTLRGWVPVTLNVWRECPSQSHPGAEPSRGYFWVAEPKAKAFSSDVRLSVANISNNVHTPKKIPFYGMLLDFILGWGRGQAWRRWVPPSACGGWQASSELRAEHGLRPQKKEKRNELDNHSDWMA